MNVILQNFARDWLKDGISRCTEVQQHFFKLMYSHKNLELPINEVIDKISEEKLDWAMIQVENTLKKNETNTRRTNRLE